MLDLGLERSQPAPSVVTHGDVARLAPTRARGSRPLLWRGVGRVAFRSHGTCSDLPCRGFLCPPGYGAAR